MRSSGTNATSRYGPGADRRARVRRAGSRPGTIPITRLIGNDAERRLQRETPRCSGSTTSTARDDRYTRPSGRGTPDRGSCGTCRRRPPTSARGRRGTARRGAASRRRSAIVGRSSDSASPARPQVVVDLDQRAEDSWCTFCDASSTPTRGSRLTAEFAIATTIASPRAAARSCAAQPRRAPTQRRQRASERRAPRASAPCISRPASSLQLGEQRQRLERREVVDVERRAAAGAARSSSADGAWNRPSCCCALGAAPLSDGRPPRDSSSRSRPVRISRARATTAGGRPGEPRDLDAVAAIGAARHDLAQEDDVVLPLADDDVEVGDAGQRVGEVGELVVVRREDRLRPRASGSTRGARRPPRPG